LSITKKQQKKNFNIIIEKMKKKSALLRTFPLPFFSIVTAQKHRWLKKNIDDLENFKNIDASMFSSMF